MTYLLDTNILVALLRGQASPEPKLFQSGAAISIITYAELLYGAKKSQKPDQNLHLVQSLVTELNLAILPLTPPIAAVFATIRLDLEAQGKKSEDFDLLIAATALAHDLCLATRNIKHFSAIPGLKLHR